MLNLYGNMFIQTALQTLRFVIRIQVGTRCKRAPDSGNEIRHDDKNSLKRKY
jgi:hypothetical protein